MSVTPGVDPVEVALQYPEAPDTTTADATPTGGVSGAPASGPAVTLSAEQLAVGTEWVVSGRLRLRRRIVTERRTVEIEVRREVIELQGETVDFHEGFLVGTALDGPPVQPTGTPAPFVAVLREEVPVITFGVRPYERVTVSMRRVQDTDTVHRTLRHEQVEISTHPPHGTKSHETKEN